MGRRFSASLAVAAAAVLLAVSAPSSASSTQEADFVSRINAERSSRGLSTLVVKSDLTEVARDWAQQMAARGSISHDPDLADKVSGWTALGDNVGKGPTVSSIHQAFMESETHRAIILDGTFNQVGVGVVKSGSTLYVTQILARRVGKLIPAPSPASSKPTAGPVHRTAPAAMQAVGLTGPIWSVDLTAKPVTVDVLMQLIELDATDRRVPGQDPPR